MIMICTSSVSLDFYVDATVTVQREKLFHVYLTESDSFSSDQAKNNLILFVYMYLFIYILFFTC